MKERRFELEGFQEDHIMVKDKQYGYIIRMDGLQNMTVNEALDFVERLNCQVSYDKTDNLLKE